MVRVKPGARWSSCSGNARRLLFVVKGEADCGSGSVGRYDALQAEAGETLAIAARAELDLFVMGLPPVVVPADSDAEFELVDGAANDRA
jgi:hypothetical protein